MNKGKVRYDVWLVVQTDRRNGGQQHCGGNKEGTKNDPGCRSEGRCGYIGGKMLRKDESGWRRDSGDKWQ